MKTALFDKHTALGAQIVDFCGWEMPLRYSSVVAEHQAVRERVGVFDVSHMGRIEVRGPQAEAFLDYLSTNRIAGKSDATATYTVWAQEDGGAVDDVIVYRQDAENFFVVVNAGNRSKDLSHMQRYASSFDVEIEDRFDSDGILAVQGKHAPKLIVTLFPEAEKLKFMRFSNLDWKGHRFILARVGYTGSPGFEIYAPNSALPDLWDALFIEGESLGIQAVGLGARDTLRLEMGFALYGHEISGEIAPTESVASWAVKLKKDAFVGKEALLKRKEQGTLRKEYGVMLKGKGVPREGYAVYYQGQELGWVTSGNQSPTLRKGIAIVLVKSPLEVGDEVMIDIRGRHVAGEVVPLPFWKEDE